MAVLQLSPSHYHDFHLITQWSRTIYNLQHIFNNIGTYLHDYEKLIISTTGAFHDWCIFLTFRPSSHSKFGLFILASHISLSCSDLKIDYSMNHPGTYRHNKAIQWNFNSLQHSAVWCVVGSLLCRRQSGTAQLHTIDYTRHSAGSCKNCQSWAADCWLLVPGRRETVPARPAAAAAGEGRPFWGHGRHRHQAGPVRHRHQLTDRRCGTMLIITTIMMTGLQLACSGPLN